MSSEEGVPVELYIYDLSNGLASVLSPAIIGRQVEGVWHTGVVAYGREFFYGAAGITSCAPGSTQLGRPHQVERLGTTFVPLQLFLDYIQGLATTSYTGVEYRLLEHNCNHFSEEVAQFLCGAHVPKHIAEQPQRDLPPALRVALQALLDNMLPPPGQAVYAGGGAGAVRRDRRDSPDFLTLNNQIEEARVVSQQLGQRRHTLAEKLARNERKKQKKRKKQRQHGHGDQYDEAEAELELEMAEAVEANVSAGGGAEGGAADAGPSSPALDELDVRRQDEAKRRALHPPIVYKDIDGATELEKLKKALGAVELSAEDKQSLEELQQYLVQGEGSWVLGDDFLAFVGRVLRGGEEAGRVGVLRCLAAAALRDDVSLVLHQDRREHAIMNHALDIDRLPRDEQLALGLLMCNLFENISSSEWLLYISEWEHNGQPVSNIRATTKVSVHCALSDDAELKDVGSALMHNIATKEVKTVVFDDVCVELAMALLQMLGSAPAETQLYRACTALARLVHHSHDVPQLVAIVGPDPAAFRGTSPRVDEQIDLIMQKVK